jgi:membrane protease YdiL (CAAX protease family)
MRLHADSFSQFLQNVIGAGLQKPTSENMLSTAVTFSHYVFIGCLAAGLLLILSYFFEDWFATYRQMKLLMTEAFGSLSRVGAVYLAFISATAEEIFFRGGIQPFAGLVWTSICFGLIHLSPIAGISAWSVWATIAGLLLGFIADTTHSLLPSILAHFFVNTVSLYRLRRSRLRFQSIPALDVVNEGGSER